MQAQHHPSSPAAAQSGAEYLAFSLGSEEYALNILQVQEIRSYEEPTKIATAPAHVKGLINLRGAIVPIVDLRMKLGVGQASYDTTTAVVIANAQDKTVGFVVDRVNDVAALSADQLQPLPDVGSRTTEHITGLGITDERTLILVDAEKLFLQ